MPRHLVQVTIARGGVVRIGSGAAGGGPSIWPGSGWATTTVSDEPSPASSSWTRMGGSPVTLGSPDGRQRGQDADAQRALLGPQLDGLVARGQLRVGGDRLRVVRRQLHEPVGGVGRAQALHDGCIRGLAQFQHSRR